jgi:hypothetical protein
MKSLIIFFFFSNELEIAKELAKTETVYALLDDGISQIIYDKEANIYNKQTLTEKELMMFSSLFLQNKENKNESDIDTEKIENKPEIFATSGDAGIYDTKLTEIGTRLTAIENALTGPILEKSI